MKPWVACVLVVATSGCPNISKDTGEGGGPIVEFDPANSIVPFPNNLVIDPTTGKVSLPPQACENAAAAAVRTGVLDKLDGFGTFEVGMQVTLTDVPDMSTTATNLVLYKRASGTTAIDPTTAQPIPVIASVGKALRFDPMNCASPAQIDAISFTPLTPLDQRGTYTFAVLDGLSTTSGTGYLPSPTWALVRQPDDPVTFDDQGNVIANRTPLDPGDPAQLAQLQGLDQVWKAHAQAVAFLAGAGHDRSSVLVAADFTTQTTTDPLDPMVSDSPAAMTASTKLGLMESVPALLVSEGVLPPGSTAADFLAFEGVPCGALPCDAIGDVFEGSLGAASYQVLGQNPLAGAPMIPGSWSDPVHPMVVNANQGLTFLATVPAGPAPATGFPLVVFGHGLGSSKESAAVFAPQLAAAGFAAIAIDFQAHGSRAIPFTTDAAVGCSGACSVTTTMTCDALHPTCPTGETCLDAAQQAISPTATQQCYAPFLSTDLGTTRDNIRQTVLDLQRLMPRRRHAALRLRVRSTRIRRSRSTPRTSCTPGISLGGIIGSTTTSVAPDINAARARRRGRRPARHPREHRRRSRSGARSSTR